uniref:Uncharacterized protein n=1 Tax=Morchella brunnea TaxID=1174671 RepID=A0A8K1MET8_9PEZI|nr:hypothetical protein LK370_mgp263 [Morchella brunnea]UBU98479.1 hypothetical protein [Morchella brunnea]
MTVSIVGIKVLSWSLRVFRDLNANRTIHLMGFPPPSLFYFSPEPAPRQQNGPIQKVLPSFYPGISTRLLSYEHSKAFTANHLALFLTFRVRRNAQTFKRDSLKSYLIPSRHSKA